MDLHGDQWCFDADTGAAEDLGKGHLIISHSVHGKYRMAGLVISVVG